MNERNKNGEQHGYWEFPLMKGEMWKGNYIDGVKDGVWKSFRIDDGFMLCKWSYHIGKVEFTIEYDFDHEESHILVEYYSYKNVNRKLLHMEEL